MNMGCHTSRRGHLSIFMVYWLDLNPSDMKVVRVIPSGLKLCDLGLNIDITCHIPTEEINFVYGSFKGALFFQSKKALF